MTWLLVNSAGGLVGSLFCEEVGHDLSLDFHYLGSLLVCIHFGLLEYSKSYRWTVHTVPIMNDIFYASNSKLNTH